MIAHTSTGALHGARTAHGYAWRGVPFAAPPVGSGRFGPPRAPAPWTGVREAVAPGPGSVQLYARGLGGEDCLYLNVWSPAAGAGRRPVLVWVHGGAFYMGSGSEYDGAALSARGDAVVVTVNYRLGPWGFLHLADLGLDEYADTANPALRDLVAALSWIRENAAVFGGDPDNVTLFGESAGGMLIGTLLGVPAAAGLFHRAILFSGAAQQVRARDEAGEVTRRLLAVLDLAPPDAGRLRQLSTEELRQPAEAVRLGAADATLGNHAFLPVIDGELLPRHPLDAVAAGSVRDVPLVIAWCRDEMAGFARGDGVLPAAQEAYGRRRLGNAAWERLAAAYRQPDASPDRTRARLVADAMFGLPAIRLAEAQARAGGPAWLMRIDHTPTAQPFDELGPAHGADVACLWSEIPTYGPLPAIPEMPPTPMDPADVAVSAALQDLVLAMAQSGQPQHAGLPPWPRYDDQLRRTLLLRAEPAVAEDPNRGGREAWAGLPLP